MKQRLKVNYSSEEIEGILIKEDDKNLVLKLDSGYNANLKKSKLEILSREDIEKKAVIDKPEIKKRKGLPKITVLHTGGTIASKVDYATGAVTSRFTAEELLGLYPELNEIADIKPEMIANLSSEDMRFTHYNLLLDAIKKAVEEGTDGIIISHGTDTMHYTSAALQYAIENLSIPVILVGAQRSSDRASSDAYSNLKAAVDFIVFNKDKDKAFRRVGICMHDSLSDFSFNILDAINAKKMHSSRRDAFKQINFPPVANIDREIIDVCREDLFTNKPEEKTKITKYDENLKIGFFKAHPHLFPEEISALSIYDAVVIEGTGLGHIAVSQFDEHTKINPKNLEAVGELIKKTKVIVGVQTVSGHTNMNIYSSGRYLQETSVLGQFMNLTTETLFIRAAYCLSQKDKTFEDCWNENLEGFDITRDIELE